MVANVQHDTGRGMQIRLLGHLEASVDDHPVSLGGSKQRAVLAMLGLEANRLVSAERLIEGLWGEEPPASAAKMVQNYVWRLRKVLAADGGAEIVTRGRAYELLIDREFVDALRFERLVGEATRGAPGDSARQALALFRGDPLADISDEPFAGAEIRRLEALRLTAAELAIDADLAEGRHQEVVGEIDALLAENPLRERLHAQRLLALYRCGRQADALAAYRDARRELVEDVGIEPGPELQRLHAAILRQDPGLAVAQAASELPPELDASASPPLIGRDEELRSLSRHWQRAVAGEGALVAIVGAYGMGKTRLAAEIAGLAQRASGTVLYASGVDRSEVALAAIARACAAHTPTLLVLDDADRAPAEVRLALQASPPARALVLVTGQEAAVLGRLAPSASLVLEPLDARGVEAIAALYAPAETEIPVDTLLAASGGVARRVHEAAGEWARREATGRVDALASRAAAGRSDARSLAEELAGSVAQLQSTLERVEPHPAPASMRCPYKGLAAFERDDAEYFFGREELVAELVAHLVGASLLAVVGPSGSGKSSVVKAGLLPALAGGVLPGSQNWAQVVFRPGEHPARELRRALRRLAPHRRGLLVVDQFEELFTACRDEEERTDFLHLLLGAQQVVIVVRADFYGRCAAYPELSRALGANHVLVGAMSRDELRRAIERPAQRVGLAIAPDLVDALLADVEGEPGALPLLSTALLELWSRREGRHLQLAAYARTGGVQGAVARLAEDAYVALDPAQQAEARRLFLRLSGEDEGGTVVRRRVALEGQNAQVVAQLTERRLLTVADGTVEVAHEALLREWPRLRGWLEEDANGRRLHHQLGAAARAWDVDARDPGSLYRGGRLASALEWAAGHVDELDATERAFLDAGRRASGRAQRRLRAGLAGMATLLVLAVVAGVIALDQRNQARGQADTAAAQRLGAQALATDEIDRSLLLARQGVALEDSVQTRGNLLGALLKSPAVTGILPVGARVAGLALSPDERRLAVKDTEANLVVFDTATRRTPEQSRVLLGSQVPAALDFDPRGSRLALGGMQPIVMDTRTWREVARPRTSAEAFDIRFSTDGQTLFATLFTGSAAVALQSFDARTGVPLHDPQLLDRRFQRPATLLVARDGRRVVTNLVGRSIVVHDARTLQPLRRLGLRAETIALSPDDRTLLVGSSTGSVRFVDLATGRVRPATGRHGGAVSAAVFSVDGRTVATAGADNRILIWDVDSGTVRETLTGHTRMITGLALSHDGGTLYSGALDGKVLIWDLAGDRRLGRPVALRPFVRGLERETGFPFPAVGTQAVSPDGATLAVGNDDGTVTLVDVRTLRRSTVRPNGDAAVLSLGYMPDGRLLVTDVRASAVMFDPRTGRAGPPLAGFGAAASPTFSADGRLMVASGRDVIRLRRLVHGRPVGRPRPYRSPSLAENAVLSPDGRDIAVTTEAGIEIVDAGTLRRRFVLPDSTSMITATTFTPDGRFFVTGNLEGSVRLWSTQTWEPARLKLPTETEEVLSLSVSPDSRLLATGSADGTIRLFDLPTRKPLGGPLPGLPNTFTSPLFTPDGAYLFAISAGGQAVRWDIRLSAWARHACMVAGRPLTRAEWADALPGRTYAPACTR